MTKDKILIYTSEAYEKGKKIGRKEALADEIKFLEWIVRGDGYTSYYYVDTLKRHLAKLKELEIKC